jgi:serine/threonine protein kinase
VLLAKKGGKNVRLADFGLSGMRGVGARHMTLAGSPFYMAPEMLNEAPEGYDARVDVWALGCTALALCVPQATRKALGLTKIVAFQSQEERACAMKAVLEGGYSSALVEFVRLCLTEEAAKRPTAAAMLRHEFVSAGGDVEGEEDEEEETEVMPSA